MFYEPKKGNPFKIDPFKSLIFPRPIGWISSISKNGVANLAPYSYFNAVADEPPALLKNKLVVHKILLLLEEGVIEADKLLISVKLVLEKLCL